MIHVDQDDPRPAIFAVNLAGYGKLLFTTETAAEAKEKLDRVGGESRRSGSKPGASATGFRSASWRRGAAGRAHRAAALPAPAVSRRSHLGDPELGTPETLG